MRRIIILQPAMVLLFSISHFDEGETKETPFIGITLLKIPYQAYSRFYCNISSKLKNQNNSC
jgi:hypothetical protein